MRQPRPGIPGIDKDAVLMVRVPTYGLADSGRGFWKRLDREARDVGLSVSKIFPAFYFLRAPEKANEDEPEPLIHMSKTVPVRSRVVAVMTTHVDDLLYAYLPEGEAKVKELLDKFDIGSSESRDFRYCGKQFKTTEEGITVDVVDNTRRIKPIRVESGRPNADPLLAHETTQLRSVVGSLSWIARQGRPDLLYRVSRLQANTKDSSVHWLKEANKVLELALEGMEDVKLRFPFHLMNWDSIGILSVSDASFANEAGRKSQQGHCHFLVPAEQLKKEGHDHFDVYPISFSSTTVMRVCRATLQAEAYSMQGSMEAGDRLRAVVVEMKGLLPANLRGWEDICRKHCMQLSLSDCNSLTSHLNVEISSKVQDKRLEIELRAIRQCLRTADEKPTYIDYLEGGDRVSWIHTSSMAADCLTKVMKPDLLLKILRENKYKVQFEKMTKQS